METLIVHRFTSIHIKNMSATVCMSKRAVCKGVCA
jgi:hypothetical protein